MQTEKQTLLKLIIIFWEMIIIIVTAVENLKPYIT
jgi:hypothetical protein